MAVVNVAVMLLSVCSGWKQQGQKQLGASTFTLGICGTEHAGFQCVKQRKQK
jgi:hypothetical protein